MYFDLTNLKKIEEEINYKLGLAKVCNEEFNIELFTCVLEIIRKYKFQKRMFNEINNISNAVINEEQAPINYD